MSKELGQRSFENNQACVKFSVVFFVLFLGFSELPVKHDTKGFVQGKTVWCSKEGIICRYLFFIVTS